MHKPSCKSNYIHCTHYFSSRRKKTTTIIQKTTVTLWKSQGEDSLGNTGEPPATPQRGEGGLTWEAANSGLSHQRPSRLKQVRWQTLPRRRYKHLEFGACASTHPVIESASWEGADDMHQIYCLVLLRPLIYLTAILLVQRPRSLIVLFSWLWEIIGQFVLTAFPSRFISKHHLLSVYSHSTQSDCQREYRWSVHFYNHLILRVVSISATPWT